MSFAALPVVVAMTLLLAALRCVRPIRQYVAVQFLLLPIGRPVLVGGVAVFGGGVVLGMAGWLLPAGRGAAGLRGLGAPAARDRTRVRLRPARADWPRFLALRAAPRRLGGDRRGQHVGRRPA